MHSPTRCFVRTTLLILLLWLCLSACRTPEEALADHARALSEIMDQHHDDPMVGVLRIEAYLQKHGPAMARQSGELMVEIDQLEGDAVDTRLTQVNATLTSALVDLAHASSAFETALKGKPDALNHARRAGIHRLLTFREVVAEEHRPSFDLFVHIRLR